MPSPLVGRIDALGADNRSGSSVIAGEAVKILAKATRNGDLETVKALALALCATQPSMASIWNAAALALRPDDAAAALTRYSQQLQRSPNALARVACDLLLTGHPSADLLSVITVSASRSVGRCLSLLSNRCRLHVVCAEGRPVLEGREFSASLAAEGIDTTLCTDAAVSSVGHQADVVLVGADAVSGGWFVNKCGTYQVVEAAAQAGIATYVVAGQDKFIGQLLAKKLRLSGGGEAEVWAEPPAGVHVVNPYFERVQNLNLAGFITDMGILDTHSIANVSVGPVSEEDGRRLSLLLDAAGCGESVK